MDPELHIGGALGGAVDRRQVLRAGRHDHHQVGLGPEADQVARAACRRRAA
jgi:hypothetical protein